MTPIFSHGTETRDKNTLFLFGWHLGSGYLEYLLSRNVADTFYYPYTIKLKYSNNLGNKYTEIDAGIATFYDASNVTISYYYTNYKNDIIKATNKTGKKIR